MIQRIEIENFQSHIHTILEPAPLSQLTVITGASDCGKTAILRALRWAFYNTPQGTDFIRAGCTFARVTITLGNGTQVIRERSRSSNYNRYIITKEDDRQVYEGFGADVPFEVRQALGIQTLTFGDLEIAPNLAEQLDGPFLGKAVSAGTRAKVLGKLAGTEEIDLAGKQLGTDLYRRNQEEKRLTGELTGLEEQLKQFEFLPMLAERIAALENLVAGVKVGQERRQLLAAKQAALKQLEAGIAAAEVVIRRWQYIDLAEYALAGAEKATYQRQDFKIFKDSLAGVEIGIQVASDILARYARLDEVEETVSRITATVERRGKVARAGDLYRQVAAAVSDTGARLDRLAGAEEAGAVVARIDEARTRRTKVAELAGKLRQAETEEKRSREAALLQEQRVADLTGAYRDALIAAGRCPICGGDIEPERLKEVI